MTKGIDVRGLQAAPPYIENETTEMGWLRADLAPTSVDALEMFVDFCGLVDDEVEGLSVMGPVPMRPDEDDEFHEAWVKCPKEQAFAYYWQVSSDA